MARLFSYGTLRLRDVQLATFGRELSGAKDCLIGFQLRPLAISDPHIAALSGTAVHPALFRSCNPYAEVEGVVFSITRQELIAADAYEAADYDRIEVLTKAGATVFVYLPKTQS